MELLHALGGVCKFDLRCKNLYRIGPWFACVFYLFSITMQYIGIIIKVPKVRAKRIIIFMLFHGPNSKVVPSLKQQKYQGFLAYFMSFIVSCQGVVQLGG